MIERLIRFKVYWNRSAQYESIVKALVVIAFAYKVWEDDPLGAWLYEHRFVAVPCIVLVYVFYRLVVGYVDKRFIRPKESIEVQKTNPLFMEMYEKVNKIYKEKFGNKD